VLVHGHPATPGGVLRLKGVFRVQRTTLLLQADPRQVSVKPIDWRRDSRVEVIAPIGTVDATKLRDALEGCFSPAAHVS